MSSEKIRKSGKRVPRGYSSRPDGTYLLRSCDRYDEYLDVIEHTSFSYKIYKEKKESITPKVVTDEGIKILLSVFDYYRDNGMKVIYTDEGMKVVYVDEGRTTITKK